MSVKRVYICCFLLCIGAVQAGTDLIIDGDLGDWRAFEHNQSGDWRIAATNTDRYFVIGLQLASHILMQEESRFVLYLETAQAKGPEIHGIKADLIWDFGKRSGSLNQAEVKPYDFGMVVAPNVRSSQFEIAFDRKQIKLKNPVRLAIEDTQSGVVKKLDYRFIPAKHHPQPELTRHSTDDLRVLAYNIEFDGLFKPERQPHLKRIFGAAKADILALQEIYKHDAQQTLDVLNRLAPLPEGQNWHTDGQEPDIILASRFPILQSASIGTFEFGAAGAFLLDTTAEYGSELLVVVAHLTCCNQEHSNYQRQYTSDAIIAFLRNVRKHSKPFAVKSIPLIITGDLNLVGETGQLHTLESGNISDPSKHGASFAPDNDGTDLTVVPFQTTGLPAVFTWYRPRSLFTSARLDYLLYSDSSLVLSNYYALFTSELSDGVLTRYGLEAEDTFKASDHLPLIADFRWKR